MIIEIIKNRNKSIIRLEVLSVEKPSLSGVSHPRIVLTIILNRLKILKFYFKISSSTSSIQNYTMDPEINPQEQLQFHKKTDTFQINLVYTGDHRLIVTMQDYVDWIIYSRQYTEEDIGEEISRKMELIDVFAAFSQTQPQCDSQKMKEMEDQVEKYQFGTIVMSEYKKLPCYKIESGGKITVYISIIDAATSKLSIYESNLKLSKVRTMTETEIESQEMWKLMLKNAKIEELCQTNQHLQATMHAMNSENEELQLKIQQIQRELVAKEQKRLQMLNLKDRELELLNREYERTLKLLDPNHEMILIMKKAGVGSWACVGGILTRLVSAATIGIVLLIQAYNNINKAVSLMSTLLLH